MLRTLRTVAVLTVISVFSIAPARAHDDHAAERAATLAKVHQMLDAGDSFAVAEYLQWSGTPLVVAGRYGDACGDLYWKAKDIRGALTVGRSAIQYCLTKSREVENEGQAKRLRVIAQELSFDMASFSWPGWEEQGITIEAADLADGLDFARLDLRLVQEMKYPPTKHANAHWIVGAQLLAAGRHSEARTAFDASHANAKKAENATKEWMAAGYSALAEHLADREHSGAQERFNQALKQLESLGNDDATFYAGQLRSVLKLLTK